MKIKVCLLLLCLMLTACQSLPTASQSYAGQSSVQIFKAARTYLAKREYSNAVKAYEALDSLYPYGSHAEQAQLEMIYAYYMADDYASSVAAADRYIRLYPRNAHVDYAFYMKGLANFHPIHGWLERYFPANTSTRDPGALHLAFNDFSQLVRLFPQSPYAADARQRMIYLRNRFARHELNLAKFYMDRKAYVAAANRANYIVQHYQSSSSTAEALRVMVKAYEAMGLEKSANEAKAVLQLNYP